MHSYLKHRCLPCIPAVVHHHVVCQHQVEIEVWPAVTEVYFQDERYSDPVNTQVRFDAIVYNAPTNRVAWQVTDINGGTGFGTIDATGLYKAPPKSDIPHGHTDIIVATAVDDPFRKAYARVVLIGRGPEPEPKAKLEIFPKQVYLYYPENYNAGDHNEYIDKSNTMQLYRATILNTTLTEVEWSVAPVGAGTIDTTGLYKAPLNGSESSKVVKIIANLKSTTIKDEAEAILINYSWPGIVP